MLLKGFESGMVVAVPPLFKWTSLNHPHIARYFVWFSSFVYHVFSFAILVNTGHLFAFTLYPGLSALLRVVVDTVNVPP